MTDFDEDFRRLLEGANTDDNENPLAKAVRNMRANLAALEKYADMEGTAPERGSVYRTFNDSLVICISTDGEKEGKACVLSGGHGTKASGEKPGELYWVDKNGYYKMREPGAEMAMSLREKLPVSLAEYFPPVKENGEEYSDDDLLDAFA